MTCALPSAIAAPSVESLRGHLGDTAPAEAVSVDQRRAKCAIYFMPGGRIELPRVLPQRILRRCARRSRRHNSAASGGLGVSGCVPYQVPIRTHRTARGRLKALVIPGVRWERMVWCTAP
jgi:hypothetical protein